MTSTKKQAGQLRNVATQHFFVELEQQIVKRLHDEATSEQGRVELLRSTGIHGTELLDEFGKLGITADGVVALRLLPLVLVAWADGNVSKEEHKAVMDAALKMGIVESTTAWILLDQWLAKRPRGVSVDAWRRYIHDVMAQMSTAAQSRLIDLTCLQMTQVAKATGGVLGFGSVSKKEQEVIHEVKIAMQLKSVP
ncbi:MAG: hypothetical protein WBD31_30390 [Rubripirellula sp.]